MPVLDAKSLRKTLGSRVLIESADLTIVRGEKVGVVGDNGAGKSTLGKILAGVQEFDTGTLTRRRGASVEYLDQDPEFPADASAEDVVMSGIREWQAARLRFDELSDQMGEPGADLEKIADEQETVGEDIERLGGWNRPDEAKRLLKSLGLKDTLQLIGTMSGGEKRRVALCRLLLVAPDLAILDEPTNHLDADTIEWLEDFLRNQFKGAIIMITHDRWLLSSVVTRTLEIESGQVHSYSGGWGAFLEGRAARLADEERAEKNRQNFLRTEIEWLRRQPKARTSKSKARIDRAHDAIAQAPGKKNKSLNLQAEGARLGSTIIEARNLNVGIAGHKLVKDLTFYLSKGDRVGIVGPSGAGKTTLLRTLLGEHAPEAGEVIRGKNTKIAYLDQMRSGLDPDVTVYDAVTQGNSTVQVGETTWGSHSYLERFRFVGEAKRQKVAGLSGGEKARLALACLLLKPANVFVLDEPTNDLDVMTLSALEDLLLSVNGAALIVSHDRYFLDRVATSVLSFVGNARVDQIQGGYSNYLEVAGSLKKAAQEEAKQEKKDSLIPAAPTPTLAPKVFKKLTYGEEIELKELPANLESTGSKITQIEKNLAEPDIYVERREEALSLQTELTQLQQKLEEMELRWLELEERKQS